MFLQLVFKSMKCTIFFCSYSLVLRHTTEEVLDACIEAIEPVQAALTSRLRKEVMDDLMEGLKNHEWFKGFDISDELPKRFTLKQWIKLAKEVQATVFIAGLFVLTSWYIHISIFLAQMVVYFLIIIFLFFSPFNWLSSSYKFKLLHRSYPMSTKHCESCP